ncbi:hypothetical protein Ct61P_15095 [Colletotrichum tofieldiae]|nr:hypothetical protein Ct61P_15095 [Colletotrichum tofieldiae]
MASHPDRDWTAFLVQVRDLVDETCVHANAVLRLWNHVDAAAALGFSCDLVLRRASSAIRLWSRMRLLILDIWLPSTMDSLRYMALRLNMVVPEGPIRDDSQPRHAGEGPSPTSAGVAAVLAAYQSLLGSNAAPSWLASCMLHREPVGAPYAAPWHFAYQPQFIRASRENRTHDAVSYLYDWAAARIAHRHELVNNPPRDVDGEPLYPNHQHPFEEADDVVLLKLPTEDGLAALTRHITELWVGVDDLGRHLSRHGLGPRGLAADPGVAGATALSAATTTVPVPPPSQPSGAWKSWSGPVAKAPSGHDAAWEMER